MNKSIFAPGRVHWPCSDWMISGCPFPAEQFCDSVTSSWHLCSTCLFFCALRTRTPFSFVDACIAHKYDLDVYFCYTENSCLDFVLCVLWKRSQCWGSFTQGRRKWSILRVYFHSSRTSTCHSTWNALWLPSAGPWALPRWVVWLQICETIRKWAWGIWGRKRVISSNLLFCYSFYRVSFNFCFAERSFLSFVVLHFSMC